MPQIAEFVKGKFGDWRVEGRKCGSCCPKVLDYAVETGWRLEGWKRGRRSQRILLERLTLALDAPEQLALSGDTDALVAVLEQLALALKPSEESKALGGDTEGSVQDAEVVSTEGGEDSSDSA